MRPSVLARLARLALACLVLAACHGDPRPPATPDAAPDAAPDAPPDAGPDAPPDAPAGEVRVRVQRAAPGSPANYTVLFYGPDHALVARETTDAAGLAAAALPQGGTVIVIDDPIIDSFDELRAIFGVEPGDELVVGPVPDAPPHAPLGNDALALTMPGHAGASGYRAGTRCGTGGAVAPAFSILVDAACQGALAVLAVAEDDDLQLLAAQRGAVTAGAGSGTLTGAWLPPETATMSITAGADPISAYFLLAPVVEGRWMSDLGRERPVAAAAGATGTLAWPAAPASTIDGRLFRVVFTRSSFTTEYQRFMRIHAASETTLAFDVAAEHLPWYSGATVNSYDVATRKASFPRSAGAPLDGQLIRIQFDGEFTFAKAWNCVVPPDWTELTLPVLPADLARFDPSSPLIDIRQVVPTGISASTYPGYAELRRGAPLPIAAGAFYNVTSLPIGSL